jgi:hypothetical protein
MREGIGDAVVTVRRWFDKKGTAEVQLRSRCSRLTEEIRGGQYLPQMYRELKTLLNIKYFISLGIESTEVPLEC